MANKEFDAAGRSTGHAVAWYSQEADARAAVKRLDGSIVKAHPICVRIGETVALQHRGTRGRRGRLRSLSQRIGQEAAAASHRRSGKHMVRPKSKRIARGPVTAADLDAELESFMQGAPEQVRIRKFIVRTPVLWIHDN